MEQKRKRKRRVRVKTAAELEWEQQARRQLWFERARMIALWAVAVAAAVAFIWYILSLVNAPPRPVIPR